MLVILMLTLLHAPGAQDPSKDRELKIVAQSTWPVPGGAQAKQQQHVVRSRVEAGEVTHQPMDEAGHKEGEEQFANRFKVREIDWKNQMIVIATAGKKTGSGFKVEITSVKLKDRQLIVSWKVIPPRGPITRALTHPAASALIERFDGPVVFDPPLPDNSPPKK